MCVLFYCEMSLSDVMFLAHTAILTVSPMRGASTFDTGKKNRNGADLKVRHALRAGSKDQITLLLYCYDDKKSHRSGGDTVSSKVLESPGKILEFYFS